MSTYEKILPNIDPDTRRFWEAARENRLLLQYCRACSRYQFYPRPWCTRCLGEVEEVAASGKGTVYSFSVIHRAPTPAWQNDVPYVVALVELAEGVRLMANIVDCRPEDVAIGMPVEVTFQPVTPEVTLPQFRPAERR